MIVLDTNVISEPMRAAPERAVVDWLNAQRDAWPAAGFVDTKIRS
jgi:predicted nucleic acid-binding protein